MSQTIPIHPDQVPQLLAQSKAELEVINNILSIKNQSMDGLEKMVDALAAGQLAEALIFFAGVQKLEYSLQIKGFTEKKSQLESMIKQLESPLSIPTIMPSKMPPFGGGRR